MVSTNRRLSLLITAGFSCPVLLFVTNSRDILVVCVVNLATGSELKAIHRDSTERDGSVTETPVSAPLILNAKVFTSQKRFQEPE
jgi:hypothetical protein